MPGTQAPEAPAPEGAGAIREVTQTRSPSTDAKANALAYFMGEAPPPGRDERFGLEVDFGPLGNPNWQPCDFRPLSHEELMKCDELATIKRDDVPGTRAIDVFRRWCYVCAYSCVSPDLGVALQARGGPSKEFPDTAALVADVFRWQQGVLQHVVAKIEERSRVDQAPEQAVREVEAGKGSS